MSSQHLDLGPWHLLWAGGRCLFGPVLWGASCCEARLLLLGWNGPGKHEGVRCVSGLLVFYMHILAFCWGAAVYVLYLLLEIVDQPGLDIFGQVYNQWKNKECECPNCKRLIAASRFAPHLEKCLGMGRNSSRIANRRWVGNGCCIDRNVCELRASLSLCVLTGWPPIITWANQRVTRKTTMTWMIMTGRTGQRRKVRMSPTWFNEEINPQFGFTS